MNEKLMKALNDQFNYEMLSGYYYVGMAAYCEFENMKGHIAPPSLLIPYR